MRIARCSSFSNGSQFSFLLTSIEKRRIWKPEESYTNPKCDTMACKSSECGKRSRPWVLLHLLTLLRLDRQTLESTIYIAVEIHARFGNSIINSQMKHLCNWSSAHCAQRIKVIEVVDLMYCHGGQHTPDSSASLFHDLREQLATSWTF